MHPDETEASIAKVSRNTAKNLSKILRQNLPENDLEQQRAIAGVQAWRSQTAGPTRDCFDVVRDYAKNVNGAVATYRLKRVSSIVSKIRRPGTNFELGTLDDIGGCRLIVPSVEDLYQAKSHLAQALRVPERKIKDYVENPANSGYRSCHLLTQRTTADGTYRVEVQIRTKLQHVWATTVEVADTIYGTQLKSPAGFEEATPELEDTENFFKLASNFFALLENCPTLNGFPTELHETRAELLGAPRTTRILEDLEATSEAVMLVPIEEVERPETYLLAFNTSTQALFVTPFEANEMTRALSMYDAVEKSNMEAINSGQLPLADNVVLVQAHNEKDLKIAYPNYSAHAPDFVRILRENLDH